MEPKPRLANRLATTVWNAAPHRLRSIATAANRNRPGNRVDWGNLRRTRPFSVRSGFERGTPADRHYIEGFVQDHRAAIRGRVLEVKDAEYTTRYGAPGTEPVIVDVDPSNTLAHVVADLCEPGSLDGVRVDCVILTQTLQFVDDPCAAVANVWSVLEPGGTLLVTVPTVSQRDHWVSTDYWRFTPLGLERLLARACPGHERLDVRGYGNAIAAIAAIHGLSIEEVGTDDLDEHDDRVPTLSAAVVVKQQQS